MDHSGHPATPNVNELPSYIDREWLDSMHPTSYDLPPDPAMTESARRKWAALTNGASASRFARCPTCQEWSPCRVRTLFEYAVGQPDWVAASTRGYRQGLNDAARHAANPEVVEPGWWHPDACTNQHNEGGNCLDADGSLVGWREPINMIVLA